MTPRCNDRRFLQPRYGASLGLSFLKHDVDRGRFWLPGALSDLIVNLHELVAHVVVVEELVHDEAPAFGADSLVLFDHSLGNVVQP